jgi:uncharacterized membrane protein YjjP (DUF1212 family)
MMSDGNTEQNLIDGNTFGTLLLGIGISLSQAGANNARIRIAISQLAALYHYIPDITVGPGSISLALSDAAGNIVFQAARTTAVHGIDFTKISLLSGLGRQAAEKGWSVLELKEEFMKCQAPGHYPRLTILLFVSLSGAAFCYTFGGGYAEMAVAFGATLCGLFLKQQMTRSNVNPYVRTYLAALSASLFTGLFHATGLIFSPVNAFSTCVLFLVPGVPLINSFIDIIEENTLSGIAGGVMALIHILAIALGLSTTIILLNLKG